MASCSDESSRGHCRVQAFWEFSTRDQQCSRIRSILIGRESRASSTASAQLYGWALAYLGGTFLEQIGQRLEYL